MSNAHFCTKLGLLFVGICIQCGALRENSGVHEPATEPTTLIKSILLLTLAGLAATLLSVAARSQESSSTPVLLPAPEIRGTQLAPNLRVASFPFATLDADNSAPDSSA